MLELVLGGARSGKSQYAQSRAVDSKKAVVFIATATAEDSEMQQRIQLHQQTRPADWQTIEEPIKLANTLHAQQENNTFIIVDCLTLWLSNLLARSEEICAKETQALLTLLPSMENDVVFVSNEVGMGIVPMGELSRRFVDEAGRLHQHLAQSCQQVTQMIAGIPHVIKQPA